MPIQVTCPSCSSRFNAPDAAAGKRTKCPKCGGVIEIPAPAVEEEVYEAEEAFQSPFSDEDFEVEPPAELPKADDRKPCPMCGEMIQKDAVKCRFCGETFDPILRAQEKKIAAKDDPDSNLTPLDWVLGIICSNIACILAIVWMVQGKPKGKKLLLVAIGANVVWFIIGMILGALEQM